MKELEIYKNMCAMVIEDDKQSAQYLKDVLSDIFLEITIANNGEEALELYYEKKPDMLFVDIMMPKMNGIELIMEIRKIDKDIKIIIISAYTSQEYLMQAVKLKLEDYLVKPIKFDKFLNLLKNIAIECKEKYPNKITLCSGAIFEPFNKTIEFEKIVHQLTKSEFKLLMFLLSNKNQTVAKELIESHLWFGGAISDSLLKSLINKLRKKIGKNAIESQSGYGYRIIL